MKKCLGIMLLGLLAGCAPIEAVGSSAKDTRAQIVAFANGPLELQGMLYKPEGAGPFPALLFNHGSAPGMLNNQAF